MGKCDRSGSSIQYPPLLYISGHLNLGLSMPVGIMKADSDDDWETDPDFVNDMSEEQQRWGGARDTGTLDMEKFREEIKQEDAAAGAKRGQQEGYKSSTGYGGKFGVEKDRMDKSAMGHDFIAKVEKHGSQVDAAKGFGGKFGVSDHKDKSALGWDHVEKVDKHESQVDHKKGFGGKYGVGVQDKSAVGWEHHEKGDKHESQKDYKSGFGGKFGVQTDRVDKSAVGWEHHEKVDKHESQKDYKTGFGGQFGVQKDRVDKSAGGWDYVEKVPKHPSP